MYYFLIVTSILLVGVNVYFFINSNNWVSRCLFVASAAFAINGLIKYIPAVLS